MRKAFAPAFALLLLSAAGAAPKPHVITFGQTLPVKLFVGAAEDRALDMKVRSLNVDGRLKEFTTGAPQDITDRVFVIRRAYRLNDVLPEDGKTAPKWKWQRGGWLMVDRLTGRVSQVNLPLFDPFYSVASWYRDYAAYCGISDDGEKVFAVVAQLGRKKAVLRRELGRANGGDMPDSECPAPLWQRQPARVTFEPQGKEKLTYTIRGHAADLAAEDESSE
jgi:hypothetical protein